MACTLGASDCFEACPRVLVALADAAGQAPLASRPGQSHQRRSRRCRLVQVHLNRPVTNQQILHNVVNHVLPGLSSCPRPL